MYIYRVEDRIGNGYISGGIQSTAGGSGGGRERADRARKYDAITEFSRNSVFYSPRVIHLRPLKNNYSAEVCSCIYTEWRTE